MSSVVLDVVAECPIRISAVPHQAGYYRHIMQGGKVRCYHVDAVPEDATPSAAQLTLDKERECTSP